MGAAPHPTRSPKEAHPCFGVNVLAKGVCRELPSQEEARQPQAGRRTSAALLRSPVASGHSAFSPKYLKVRSRLLGGAVG